ncbi:MAG: lecithin retinol acyltransferase family protein [Lachnospiraceae bacterium]|nr:lecithin retinol acyltransferase family protein [Lachnospiraceae bacterium]
MVKVKVNSKMDHYGVFISDEEVIQFGKNPALLEGVPESEVRVCSTDIDEFRNGGFPEFADLTISEKLKRFKTDKIIDTARSRIGQDGYNIVFNNCEHFAYECIFGKKYSSQSETAKEVIKEMATGKTSERN